MTQLQFNPHTIWGMYGWPEGIPIGGSAGNPGDQPHQAWLAQTFTAAVSGRLTDVVLNAQNYAIDLRAYAGGSLFTVGDGPFTISILGTKRLVDPARPNDVGPDTSRVLATTSVVVEPTDPSLAPLPPLLDISFATPASIQAGMQYAIYLAGPAGQYVQHPNPPGFGPPTGSWPVWFSWADYGDPIYVGNVPSPYAGGAAWLLLGSGTRELTNQDFNFQTYVVPGVAPVSPVAPPTSHPGPYLAGATFLRWCTNLSKVFCVSPFTTLTTNTDLKMACWRDDSLMTGLYSSPRWFYVRTPTGSEGFVHSSYVRQQANVPNCSTFPWLKATDWALDRVGQSIYAGQCLGFIAAAYKTAGRPIPGPYGASVSAASWWAAQSAAHKHASGTPPRGALVFWGARKGYPDGHVALSLGNGYVVSSSERTTTVIHTFPTSARSPSVYHYLGWWS